MQLRHRTSSSRGCRSVVDASILFKQGNARNLSYCTCSRCTEKTCYFILSGVLGRLANVFLFRCKHAKCLYTFSKNCAWTAGHCAWHANTLALKLQAWMSSNSSRIFVSWLLYAYELPKKMQTWTSTLWMLNCNQSLLYSADGCKCSYMNCPKSSLSLVSPWNANEVPSTVYDSIKCAVKKSETPTILQ